MGSQGTELPAERDGGQASHGGGQQLSIAMPGRRKLSRRLSALSSHVGADPGVHRSEACGLFVDDYARLPSLTNDMLRAKADIDEFGYCIWGDAISRGEIRAMALRLWSQAQAEERGGLVSESAIKQNARFISCIINKGEEFEPLLTHPVASELLSHMLGEHFNLSTGFAKILMPGASAETLHTDQWWSAPPQKRLLGQVPSQPKIRSGSITRELAYTADWHTGANGLGTAAGKRTKRTPQAKRAA